MGSLNNAETAAKCVEISKCLINKSPGLYSYYLHDTKNTGELARFAANIQCLETITFDQLISIGNATKIDYGVLTSSILPTLKDLSWIDIKLKGKTIERIDEHIPPQKSMLSTLGAFWEDNNPTDIDVASINSLSISSKSPITKEALISELEIEEEAFKTTLGYGEQASYLGTFHSKALDTDIVWTPFYWAGKLENVLDFLSRQSDTSFNSIEKLCQEFLSFNGKPLEQITGSQKKLVNDGISHGFFPTVSVVDSEGIPHKYIFPATPVFEVTPEKDIFEKARLIVGCIRHGQYHAKISRVKYPISLLNSIRENRISTHSYAIYQYSPMITHGICKCYESISDRYQIEFVDSEANRKAMDIAEEMLSGSAPFSGITYEPEVKELMVNGTYRYTSQDRIIPSSGNISAESDFRKLIDMSLGVRV